MSTIEPAAFSLWELGPRPGPRGLLAQSSTLDLNCEVPPLVAKFSALPAPERLATMLGEAYCLGPGDEHVLSHSVHRWEGYTVVREYTDAETSTYVFATWEDGVGFARRTCAQLSALEPGDAESEPYFTHFSGALRPGA